MVSYSYLQEQIWDSLINYLAILAIGVHYRKSAEGLTGCSVLRDGIPTEKKEAESEWSKNGQMMERKRQSGSSTIQGFWLKTYSYVTHNCFISLRPFVSLKVG